MNSKLIERLPAPLINFAIIMYHRAKNLSRRGIVVTFMMIIAVLVARSTIFMLLFSMVVGLFLLAHNTQDEYDVYREEMNKPNAEEDKKREEKKKAAAALPLERTEIKIETETDKLEAAMRMSLQKEEEEEEARIKKIEEEADSKNNLGGLFCCPKK